jgi:hypothetical protein
MTSGGAGMNRSTDATFFESVLVTGATTADVSDFIPNERSFLLPIVKKLCGSADNKVMLRLLRRPLALLLFAGSLTGLSVGGFPAATERVVEAGAAPWTVPTSPPRCTQAQADSGDVATCVLMAGAGLPETRGWPAAPFPSPENPTVVTWLNLSLGANEPTVAKVQEALNKLGSTLIADGQFGAQTYTAVKAYQTSKGLTATGVVDKAMADKLGVQRTIGGTFPPTGWKWLGWGYNGSPALATFEKQLVSNKAPIGAMRVGQLRSFADSLPLFENFYAEIQAKGYVINDGGTWVFRCTASTRKDCAGQTRYSLSNHAFGLASDINTVKNPMVRYYAINGVTACSTPMKTDLPRWVVQIAEKWGLYWGGYGWTSGCQTPTQWRASVSRDPMHFEFNGSPAQAQAILRRNLGSGKCIDVVNEAGQPVNWCLMKGEVPGAGTRLAVGTAPPTGATAVVVNVVTLNAASGGSYTAEDCAARPKGPRTWSNGNVRVGRTTSTITVVPLDASGRFCLYQSAAFQTIVDVQGYFVPSAAAPTGALFTPVGALRTLDTGATTYCGPEGTCVAPRPTTPNTEVLNIAPSAVTPVAALANITTSGAAAGGYVTAGTCDAIVPGPQSYSNLNFSPLDPTAANTAFIPTASTEIGATFCTYATAALREVVDVTGFFNPPQDGGLGFTAQTPTRLVDTRRCWADPITTVQRCSLVNDAGSIVRVAAPPGASAVLINLTAVGASANGSLAPAACSAFVAGQRVAPITPTLVGAATANLAAVPVDPDGTFCVKVTSSTHVVVDLLGTFSPTGDLRFVLATPRRLISTR